MRELDAGHPAEQLAAQVRAGAGARRGVIEFAGIFSGISDQFRDAARWYRGMHRDQVGHGGEHADHGEVLVRVVRQGGTDGRLNHQRRHRGQQQGVAIGCGLGDHVGADQGAGTGLVLDDHALPELLR
jgi:hypothetical protein